jgi:twitching motility protein PilT
MNDYEAILDDDLGEWDAGNPGSQGDAHSNKIDDDSEGLIRALEHEHDVDISIPDSYEVSVDDPDASEVRVEDAFNDEQADPDGDVVLVSETIRRDEDDAGGEPSSQESGEGDLSDGGDAGGNAPIDDDTEDGDVWDQPQDDGEESAQDAVGSGAGESIGNADDRSNDHAVPGEEQDDHLESNDAHEELRGNAGVDTGDDHENPPITDDSSNASANDHIKPDAMLDQDHDGVDDREESQSIDAMAMRAGSGQRSDDGSPAAGNGSVSREELKLVVRNLEERAAGLGVDGSGGQLESGLPLPSSDAAVEDDHADAVQVKPTADGLNRLIGPSDVGREAFDVDAILNDAIDHRASDVHIMAGRMIKLRIDGIMYGFTKYEPMDSYDMNAFVTDPGNGLVDADNMNEFRRTKSVDKAYVVKTGRHVGERFRVHMAEEFHGYGFVFRHVRPEIFTPEEIGIPDDVMGWTRLGQGLILVTGPTGSGKSATLATLIRSIQLNRAVKIITLEEPIETLYPLDGLADIWQKEIPDNEDEFEQGVRDAMREDPDVMLIGEIRDIGTLRATMQACNTGHLVFATIHASSAPDVITRVMEFAGDGSDREQLRSDLARNLRGILSQRLLLRKGGAGRLAVREIMHVDAKTRRLIIGNDVDKMTRSLKMRGEDLDSQALLLALEGRVSVRSALSVSADPNGFIAMTSLLSDRARRLIDAVGDWTGAPHDE